MSKGMTPAFHYLDIMRSSRHVDGPQYELEPGHEMVPIVEAGKATIMVDRVTNLFVDPKDYQRMQRKLYAQQKAERRKSQGKPVGSGVRKVAKPEEKVERYVPPEPIERASRLIVDRKNAKPLGLRPRGYVRSYTNGLGHSPRG